MLKRAWLEYSVKNLAVSALILGTSIPQLAAQQAPAETAPVDREAPTASPAGKKTEKISVIGSRIKRTSIETSSPTVTISRQDIKESGVATVGELLRTQATASTGNFAGSGGFVRSGSQTGNLYGLGSGRTLVLVDGERLPRDASLGGTNLALIPTAMVERVEILSGSKSAIYGSDAVAGVINIVTRRDFEGNEVETSLHVPEDGGGEAQSLSVTSGINFESGSNLVLSAGASRKNGIYRKNRAISFGTDKFAYSQGSQAVGTYNFRLLDGATFRPLADAAGLWQPSANCPAGSTNDQRGPGEPDRGIFCVGETKKASSSLLIPGTQGGFVSGKLNAELGELGRLSGFLAYTRSEAETNRGNFFSNDNYLSAGRRQILSAARATELGLNTQGNAVEVFQIDSAAPDVIRLNTDQSYGGFLALDSDWGSDWSSNLSLTRYTTQNEREVKNVINKQRYSVLVHGYVENADGTVTQTGNPAYSSLDPNRDPALLASVVDTLKAKELNVLTSLSGSAGREFFELPGGRVGFNVGFDVRKEEFKQTPDPRDTEFWQNLPLYTGTEGTSGEGDRSVLSSFAEILVPVLPELNFDVALRFDSYSDVGEAGTYNIGAKYDALESLTLRFNQGTSFRAPELSYVHQKGGGGYTNIRDDKWCDARVAQGIPCVAGETHQIFVDRPGNKELTPETARSYVFGAIYEPNRNFYMSLDYAAFAIKNVFNLRPAQDLVDDLYEGKEIGPGSANLDPQYGFVTSLANPWLNIGQERIYLLKGELSYQQDWGDLGFRYRTDGTRTLSRHEQQTDGTLKQLNGIEAYPKWRWNNVFSLLYGGVKTSLLTSTIAKQAPDPENTKTYKATYFNDSVPEYTRYDLSAEKSFETGTQLTLGVQNLANKIGGTYRTGNFTGNESSESALYGDSWNGRTYFAKLSQSF